MDAGLLVIRPGRPGATADCRDHTGLRPAGASAFGYRDGQLIADVTAYERWKHLNGGPRWRSGVKHDCAKVFELRRATGGFLNGFGQCVELEPDFVYPLLKSSDLGGEAPKAASRWLLVPQAAIGEDTASIERRAPKTWKYLLGYARLLDARGSSIYRNRPRFSVFGVGAYSFTAWKVAVSGLYKRLQFRAVGPRDGKPVVFDDTCYFLPCSDQAQAETIARLLSSDVAAAFFSAFVFWDAKRPITAELLQRLDLTALAKDLGVAPAVVQTPTHFPAPETPAAEQPSQGLLFPR